VLFVGNLLLCLHGAIVGTRHRGYLSAWCLLDVVCRRVTFVRELHLGVTFAFALCHRVVLSL